MKNLLFTFLFAITSFFAVSQDFNVSLFYDDLTGGAYQTDAYDDTVYLDLNETITIQSAFGQNNLFSVWKSDYNPSFLPYDNFMTSTGIQQYLPYTYTFQSGFTNFVIYVRYTNSSMNKMYKLLVINNQTSSVDDLSSFDFNVYPNPSTDFINIETEYDGEFTIFDMSGKLVVKTEDKRIDVSFLNTGQYFIKVGSSTKIFMKQ